MREERGSWMAVSCRQDSPRDPRDSVISVFAHLCPALGTGTGTGISCGPCLPWRSSQPGVAEVYPALVTLPGGSHGGRLAAVQRPWSLAPGGGWGATRPRQECWLRPRKLLEEVELTRIRRSFSQFLSPSPSSMGLEVPSCSQVITLDRKPSNL